MGRAIGGGKFHTENEAWGRDAETSPLFADSNESAKRGEVFSVPSPGFVLCVKPSAADGSPHPRTSPPPPPMAGVLQ